MAALSVGEGEGGEGYGNAAAVGFGAEASAELGVGGYSAGDYEGTGAECLGCGEGLAEEIAYYGVLEGGYKVQGLLVYRVWGQEREGLGGTGLQVWVGGEDAAAGFDGVAHVMGLGVAEDCGFYSAEGEVVGGLSIGGRG